LSNTAIDPISIENSDEEQRKRDIKIDGSVVRISRKE